MATPRKLPGFNGVNGVTLQDFKTRYRITDVSIMDGGMYGRRVCYFFLNENPAQLYTCNAYQSSGWSSNYTCDYNIAEEAEWGGDWLPESASAMMQDHAESEWKAIKEEIQYIARVMGESTEGKDPERVKRHNAHIEARQKGLFDRYKKHEQYLALAKMYNIPRGRLVNPKPAF